MCMISILLCCVLQLPNFVANLIVNFVDFAFPQYFVANLIANFVASSPTKLAIKLTTKLV